MNSFEEEFLRRGNDYRLGFIAGLRRAVEIARGPICAFRDRELIALTIESEASLIEGKE